MQQRNRSKSKLWRKCFTVDMLSQKFCRFGQTSIKHKMGETYPFEPPEIFIELGILLLKTHYSFLYSLLFCFVSFFLFHLNNVKLKLFLFLSFEKILVIWSEKNMHIFYGLIPYLSGTLTRVIKEGKHKNTKLIEVAAKI